MKESWTRTMTPEQRVIRAKVGVPELPSGLRLNVQATGFFDEAAIHQVRLSNCFLPAASSPPASKDAMGQALIDEQTGDSNAHSLWQDCRH
jgi:hypothetical protein